MYDFMIFGYYASAIATTFFPAGRAFASLMNSLITLVAFCAAWIGVERSAYLGPDQMARWGWRIPLLAGCAIIPFVFVIRLSLTETDEFLARKYEPNTSEILHSVVVNWRAVLLGTML